MANGDIDIVVGAKDQASRILDDIANNTRKIGRAAELSAKTTVDSSRRMVRAINAVKAASGPLLVAYAAIKAAAKVVNFAGSSLDAFEQQRDAIEGLTSAIQMNGDELGPTIDQHAAFASQLQNLTNVGDETTLALMKQASMLGVNNEDLQDTTKAAIGLAEALDISTSEALKKVMNATEGNASALAEFIPSLRNLETEEEKLAAVLDLAGKGLDQKALKANTAAGAMDAAKGAVGDFSEVVGEALAPVQKLVGKGIEAFAKSLTFTLQPAVDGAESTVSDFADNVSEKMITAMATVHSATEVTVMNLPRLWEMATTSTELQLLRMQEISKHTFTVTIPAYTEWFSRNHTKLMEDTFNGALTIVRNATEKIANVYQTWVEFLQSGAEGGLSKLFENIGQDISGSLLEGFTAQTESLPEIMARSITDREQMLQDKLARTGTSLAEAFNKNFKARLEALRSDGDLNVDVAAKGKFDTSELMAIGNSIATPGLGAMIGPLAFLQERLADVLQASGGLKDPADSPDIQAKESRLLTRGPGVDIAKQQLEVNKNMLKQLEQIPKEPQSADTNPQPVFKVVKVT